MTEKKLVEIKSIEIQVGKKTLTLSPEEARDLKEALDKLYPSSRIVKEKEYVPQPYPVYPKIYPYYDTWYKFTTSDNTNSAVNLLSENRAFYSSDNIKCFCTTN